MNAESRARKRPARSARPDAAGHLRRRRSSSDPARLLSREWLVTNGLGGYAAGTLAGVITRRYHGLLIAALPAPLGRLVMVSQLGERLRLPGGRVHWLSGEERQGGTLYVEGANRLREFRLEAGLPVWTFEIDGYMLEKRLLLPRFQNTVLVTYTLLRGDGPSGWACGRCSTRGRTKRRSITRCRTRRRWSRATAYLEVQLAPGPSAAAPAARRRARRVHRRRR